MHGHMNVKNHELLSVLHFGSPFPAVMENVEIKTNSAVRIRNFQDPQHPVEWSCSKHVLFKQKYLNDSLENLRIYYPVHVLALTAGQYAKVAGWWYE